MFSTAWARVDLTPEHLSCAQSLSRLGSAQDSQAESTESYLLEARKFLYARPGEAWGHHRLVSEVQYSPSLGQFTFHLKLLKVGVEIQERLDERIIPLQIRAVFFMPQKGEPGSETHLPEGVVLAHQDPSRLGSHWAMLFSGEAFRREVEMGGIPLLEEAGPYDIVHCPKSGQDMSAVQAAVLTRVPEQRSGGQRQILICF